MILKIHSPLILTYAQICDTVITDRPIAVSSFGKNLYEYSGHIINDRPNGRKDYLISFVAKGTFYETTKRIIMKENSLVIYKPYEPQLRLWYDPKRI